MQFCWSKESSTDISNHENLLGSFSICEIHNHSQAPGFTTVTPEKSRYSIKKNGFLSLVFFRVKEYSVVKFNIFFTSDGVTSMSLFSKIKSSLKGPTIEEIEADTPFTYSLAETLKEFDGHVVEKTPPVTIPAPSSNNYIHYQMAPITNKILATQSLREVITTLTGDLMNLFDCELVTIFGLDRQKRQIYSRNFQWKLKDEIRLNISMKSLAGFVAATGKILQIKDAQNSKELASYHPSLKLDDTWDGKFQFKTRSVLAVPLSHNKQLMGVLELINKKTESAFTAMDLRMAKEISLTLGRALMRAEVEELENELKSTVHSIHSAKSPDEIFIECQESLLQLFSAQFVTIYAVDFDSQEIYSKYKTGDSIQEIRLPISCESIAGFVASKHQQVNIPDVYDDLLLKELHPDLNFDKSWDKKTGIKTRSILASPLMYENQIMGVLQIANKPTFNKYDEKTIASVSNTIGLALFNQRKKQDSERTTFSYLVDRSLLSREELRKAITTARIENREIENILLDEFKLKRSDIGKSLELFYKTPYTGYPPSSSTTLSEEEKNLCIKSFNNNSECVLLEIKDHSAKVLMPDPSDQKLIEEIKKTLARETLEINVGLKADILDYIADYSTASPSEPLKNTAIQPDSTDTITPEPTPTKQLESLDDLLEEEPEIEIALEEVPPSPLPYIETNQIAKDLVNEMLADAHEKNASHIHVEPGLKNESSQIRFRIDGVCRLYKELPEKSQQMVLALFKGMSKKAKAAGDTESVRFKIGNEELEYSLVFVSLPGSKEELIIRSRSNVKFISLERMGIASRNLNIIQRNISLPHGLIIVAGTAGAGKTVTLHSLLDRINIPEKKIWTAETSIEIVQKGLRQVQMEGSFADIRNIFMQADPDVIMVEEMQDSEACEAVLDSSSRGYLTFSSVHANSAPLAIERLLSLTSEPRGLAESLTLVIAQQLVRTLCRNCKEDYHPSEEEFNFLVSEYGEKDFPKLGLEYGSFLTFKRPMGCKMCNESGFSGRTALHEVLEVTPKIKRLIRCKGDIEEIRKQAQKEGMTTMKQDAIVKVLKGTCDLKHAFSHFQS